MPSELPGTDVVVAVQQLLARYTHFVDRGPWHKISSLFTADAEFVVRNQPIVGRDAIHEFYRARSETELTSRHVVTNVLVDAASVTEAEVISTITLYREIGGTTPVLVGDYHDVVRLDDGVWRFARRRLEITFFDERARAQG